MSRGTRPRSSPDSNRTPAKDVRTLLRNDRYEPRLVAVNILDFRARAKRISEEERGELFDLYLSEHAHIDSWDLVDRAAPRVIGNYPDRPYRDASR